MNLELNKQNWPKIKEALEDGCSVGEQATDPEGFKLVEEGEWIDDGKYASQETVFQDLSNNKFFRYWNSRSGSYFTDYYYSDISFGEVQEVEPTEVVVKTWKAVGKKAN